jgi:hypothetical protein
MKDFGSGMRTKEWKLLKLLSLVSLVMFLIGAATGAWAQKYEIPQNRKASDILPAEVIKGPHYQIRDKVVSYGYMHKYTVDSDFGVFETTGDGALRKLLREIQAIVALTEIKKSEAFAKSVGEAAKKPISFGKNLITDPADTLSGIPKGIGTLFENVATSIKTPRDPSEDSRVESALTVSSYKREYAGKMGVDVYSSNRVLQKELNSVGWASALGSLGITVATIPFSAPGVLVFKSTRLAQQFNEMLTEEPPARLRIINGEKLAAMGVSKQLADRFLDHPQFTPRHDTIIVGSLESLKGATGRDAFIQFALSADSETTANFFMNMAQTMRGYHETVSPVKEIKVVPPFVLAKATNGSVLIPFPLDHGVWSQRAEQVVDNMIAAQKASGPEGKLEMWMTGTVSPLARKQLEQRGIKVVQDVDKRMEFVD